MISRIAAAFVLVFYIALLVDAGLEFLGLGDTTHVSWGMTLYWAQIELEPSCRASGGRSSSPGSRSCSPSLGLVFLLAGIDEVSNPRLRNAREAKRSTARRRTRSRRWCRDRAPIARDAASSCAGSRESPTATPFAPSTASTCRSRRRDPRPRRRVGLRQEHGRERRHADPAAARAASPAAASSSAARTWSRRSTRGAAPLPLAQRLDGLPERDERAQPGDAGRRPVRRHDAGARAHLEARRARSAPASCSSSSASTRGASARIRTSSPAACASA